MGELVKGKISGGCCGGGGPRWGVGGTRGQSAIVRATRNPTRCWEQASQPAAACGCSWRGRRPALLWWLLVAVVEEGRETNVAVGRAAGWPVAGGDRAAHWRCKEKREKKRGEGWE